LQRKKITVEEKNNQIKIKGLANFIEEEFINWKNNIPLIESEGVALSPRSHSLKENKHNKKEINTIAFIRVLEPIVKIHNYLIFQ